MVHCWLLYMFWRWFTTSTFRIDQLGMIQALWRWYTALAEGDVTLLHKFGGERVLQMMLLFTDATTGGKGPNPRLSRVVFARTKKCTKTYAAVN